MHSPESQPVVPTDAPQPIKASPEVAPLSEEDKEKIRAEFEALDENKDTKSLYVRWKKDFEMLEETDEEAFLRAVQKRLTERAQTLSLYKFRDTTVFQITDKGLVKEIQETLSDFEALRHNESYCIGSGQYAKVYMDTKSSKVAVKYLFEDGEYKTQKALMENECELMEKLFDFRVEGVRIPYIFKKNGEMESSEAGAYNRTYTHYLVMERINGFSLRDIVDTKKAGQEFVALLKSIDKKVLHEKLTLFLKEMHEVKKIIHGDIHAGNIMIDKGGNIFVIDFGKGKKTDTVSSDNEVITDKREADGKLAYEGTTTMGESKTREFEELAKTLQKAYETLLTM